MSTVKKFQLQIFNYKKFNYKKLILLMIHT